nr:glycosyltransferase family 1 protein [Propionibacterium sp.]
DDANAAAAADAGLTYRGRPGFAGNPVESQQILTHALSRAKFALAFSNKHSPAAYTHPTREYLTARWTMALAAGASVAGIAPRCLATDELLWDGALVEFESTDRQEGLERLASAVAAWTPRCAQVNRAEALRKLDWRWRFREIAVLLGRRAPSLDDDLALLTEKLDDARAEVSN